MMHHKSWVVDVELIQNHESQFVPNCRNVLIIPPRRINVSPVWRKGEWWMQGSLPGVWLEFILRPQSIRSETQRHSSLCSRRTIGLIFKLRAIHCQELNLTWIALFEVEDNFGRKSFLLRFSSMAFEIDSTMICGILKEKLLHFNWNFDLKFPTK